MPYSYVTLDELKLRLDIGETDVADEPTLRRVLEAASRRVDGLCGGRRFQPYTATRTFTARWSDELEVDDLLTVTTLKTLTLNTNGTRTYGDTWSTTDYDLQPYDAPDAWEPYTMVAINPAGDYSFPTESRGVEIAGVWGYWLETEASGSLLNGAVSSTSATTITVDDGLDFDRLQTILIDSEAMYVTGIAGNVLTVLRGQNGTTAATHLNDAAVSIYRYPAEIVEATALLAARQYRRSDAPLGIAGADALGTATRIASKETDALTYVATYRRVWGMAAR